MPELSTEDQIIAIWAKHGQVEEVRKKVRNYQQQVFKAGGEEELLDRLQQKYSRPSKPPSTSWDRLVEWMWDNQVPFNALSAVAHRKAHWNPSLSFWLFRAQDLYTSGSRWRCCDKKSKGCGLRRGKHSRQRWNVEMRGPRSEALSAVVRLAW